MIHFKEAYICTAPSQSASQMGLYPLFTFPNECYLQATGFHLGCSSISSDLISFCFSFCVFLRLITARLDNRPGFLFNPYWGDSALTSRFRLNVNVPALVEAAFTVNAACVGSIRKWPFHFNASVIQTEWRLKLTVQCVTTKTNNKCCNQTCPFFSSSGQEKG